MSATILTFPRCREAGRAGALDRATAAVTGTVTEADVAAGIAAYDPAIHRAYAVVGRQGPEARLFGWVRGVLIVDGTLHAEVEGLDPALVGALRVRRFRMVEAGFLRPEAAGNPMPGRYCLHHIRFAATTVTDHRTTGVPGLCRRDSAGNGTRGVDDVVALVIGEAQTVPPFVGFDHAAGDLMSAMRAEIVRRLTDQGDCHEA